MKSNENAKAEFNVTEKFKRRALELLDESQAMQFAEGLRLNNALATVFSREKERLAAKYGADDSRPKEMAVRLEASSDAKVTLFTRYSDAMTPQTTADQGWAVDGFVRTVEGATIDGLNVAAYDKDGNIHKDLGKATTDKRGFFSIKVERLPQKPPKVVFMRASKGSRLLDSKEVRLTPEAGSSERVVIVLTERGGNKPEKPVQPDKPIIVVAEKPPQPDKASVPTTERPQQPEKATVPVAEKPVQPDKASVPVAEKPVLDKPSGATRAAKKPAEPPKASVVTASKPAVVIAKSKATKRTPAKARPKTGTKTAAGTKAKPKPRAKSPNSKK